MTTHTSAGLEVKSPNGTLELVPRERLVIARLEIQGRRIIEALGKLDRSSQRECEAPFQAWFSSSCSSAMPNGPGAGT